MTDDLDMTDDDFGFLDDFQKDVENTNQDSSLGVDDDGIPILLGKISEYPDDFIALVKIVKSKYRELGAIDINQMYEDLDRLVVHVEKSAIPQVIAQKLGEIQAAKDRLSEIYLEVTRCYSLKKRCLDLLKEAWNKYSGASSADKRKGDALSRLINFELDFAEIEALDKSVKHIGYNLTSGQNVLTEQLRALNLQIKIHENPVLNPVHDLDINSSFAFNDDDNDISGPKEIDEEKSQEAQEVSF